MPKVIPTNLVIPVASTLRPLFLLLCFYPPYIPSPWIHLYRVLHQAGWWDCPYIFHLGSGMPLSLLDALVPCFSRLWLPRVSTRGILVATWWRRQRCQARTVAALMCSITRRSTYLRKSSNYLVQTSEAYRLCRATRGGIFWGATFPQTEPQQ